MKTIFTFMIILLFSFSQAQERVSIGVYQDAKLGIIGDKKRNYSAGTLDILINLKMQGNQQKYGYMIVYPSFEYAEIKDNYKRYSANVGYVLNRLIIDDFEASASIGYGFISRYKKSLSSFGLDTSLSYKISDRFKITALCQIVDRKDLKMIWATKNTIKMSGFLGLEFNLN